MTQVNRILIVGAGPAGLALALALGRQGQVPEIIDRAPDWPMGGAGLYLVGNGTRALRALGLAEAVVRAGQIIRTQTFCDSRGAALAKVDVAAYWNACGPCLGLRRADLLRLMAEQLRGLPVRWNMTVTALQPMDGEVAVQYSDGTAGAYDLVVGADGIRSSIRRLLIGDVPPRYRRQIAWRFIAPRPDGVDGWTVFLGQRSAFLLVPVDATHAYCYADLGWDEPTVSGRDATPERLQALYRTYAAPVQQVLHSLSDREVIAGLPIEDVVPQHWGRGRVVLIGDAAHAMSPNMASGAALAFEDALVLAELLAQGVPAGELAARLASRRGPRTAWVGQQTERRDRTRELPPLMRNVVLRLLGTRMYHRNYRPLLELP